MRFYRVLLLLVPAAAQDLFLSVVIPSEPSELCNLAGVWNINVNSPGHAISLTITQAPGSGNFSLAWEGNHADGQMTGSHNMEFNSYVGRVSASPYADPATKASAPDCTFLNFTMGARWCREPFCEGSPTPTPPSPQPDPPANNPETLMVNVVVPGAAAIGAVYPNGEPANYFLNYTGSAGWVIHLSGGGWRFLKPQNGAADASMLSSLTSDGIEHLDGSAGDIGHCYGKCDGVLSDDPKINPLFYSFNKVWIPISGTSFTGDRASDQPYPVRGKRIQEAVIRDLQARYHMNAASDVILTGGSSGGLAVYLTCDRVGDLIGKANATTRYTCLADAGFFLDHPDINGKPSQSPSFEESFVAWNSSGGTNQDCIAHYTPLGTPEKCIFAQYVFPFIKSSIFVMQNLYDSWQVNNILRIGCAGYNKPMDSCNAAQMSALEAYGATMRIALSPAIASPKVGIFAPSCIAHCQSVSNEHAAALWEWPARWGIEGLTPQKAFDVWYAAGGVGGTGTKHVQACDWGSSCNPLCPMWT